MTRTTPELALPNFLATPTGGRLATTYDLACNRPHTRRIFSGIGFRTCGPPVPMTPLAFLEQYGINILSSRDYISCIFGVLGSIENFLNFIKHTEYICDTFITGILAAG
ncbi:hypothetical protein AVEN_254533-2 [Araneus ventricosus]|uniref:Uncharacterized protein n=1 Tax=Araneus ventricosus TaxID=182803 RepID=A0A4Y2QNC3_ARAVE|nr:hypothetical protein AVEN_254533-2 [Araneus ventricosus]